MTTESSTAPGHRRDDARRLGAWLLLMAILIAVAYVSRATEGKPDPQSLYEFSFAAGALIQDGLILGFVLVIAGFSRGRLALRRPVSWKRAIGLLVAGVAAIYVFEGVYGALVHPGNEQGLTPAHWEPRHAAAYIVNGIVICTFVPFVEELTFRGLGYSVLERFGRWPAIVGVGLVFGLAHGLVLTLPVLAAFGAVLAWIRSETRSTVPGMILHGTFNLISLVASVAFRH